MEPDRIRNVVLVGHSGSGKTSIAEALMYAAGVTTRLGTVADGNTVTDYEPEEVDRQSSINLAVAPIDWHGYKINVIDTPGYSDFIGEVRSALRAADLALFVVSGTDGVEVQTELIWKLAVEEGIARAFFINKLDRERASYTRVLAELKEAFGTGVAPVEMPVGSEADLRGVAGIVTEHAFMYEPGKWEGKEVEPPEDIRHEIEEVHTSLVEAVVENDEELLEAYFEGTMPTQEQLVEGLRHGIADRSIYPVLCGSATTLVGIDRLADLIIRDGPSPLDRPMPPIHGEDEFTCNPNGPVEAYVFKTISDPYLGRISLFRLFSGTIKADDVLGNPRVGANGKLHNLFFMHGKEHDDTSEVSCGDIAAVAKLETVLSGDTLRAPGSDVVIDPVELPSPNMWLAVEPKTTHDEEKLSTALAKAAEEDTALTLERRLETNQTVLAGQGDIHLEMALARMARKFGVEVTTEVPKVPYRESIRGRADVEGKHKKQSGGRGQFGVAFVKFEPLPDGDYEFVDAIKGGSIPKALIPAVDRGIQTALQRGFVAGYPVVGVRATAYDGKFHSVDSDEMSFRMAGIQAVRAAAKDVQPILLEPYVTLKVTAPEAYMGDIIGDLNSKRGRVGGMDAIGRMRVVTGDVPLAEVQRYTIDLRSITGGRGAFELEFSHYEEMPPQEAQKVIAAYQAEKDG
ncbi:MAG: elongation factor G [Acidimicrobiia bacterium]|nr:elongation factor G [Acidimicrobiia bacterium]RZV43535.1 MAG: elongation factor G [Acidimicrobiia bacterium]